MTLSSSRRGYRSPLRQEHAAATRLHICQTAARLFASQGYGPTTMAQVAREAGVSAQTVYDAFASKVGVARAVLELATSGDDVSGLLNALPGLSDPVAVVQHAAQVTRRILERGTRAIDAMRRSGDDELLAEWRSWEKRRYEGQRMVIAVLEGLGAARTDRTAAQNLDVLWALTGRDLYELLVIERRWRPDAYEQWLAEALSHELLRAT